MEWTNVLGTAVLNTKETILKALHEGKTVVTFTKLDGTHRTMNCTLHGPLLPGKTVPVGDGVTDDTTAMTPAITKAARHANPDVCVVYDLDKQAWRSFRWNSVMYLDMVIK